MPLYQNQLQEDVFSEVDTRRKGEFIKKPSPTRLDHAADAAKDAKLMREDLGCMATLDDNTTRSFDDDEVDFDDEQYGAPLSFWYEKINLASEKARAYFTSEAEKVRNMDFADIIEGGIKSVENCVYDLPNREQELKVVTSICLFFYGGSWAVLATIMAAAEIFDTKEVLAAAYQLVWKFMSLEAVEDGDDVTPSQLTESFKKVGMHLALMLTVLHCDAWAELCVTLAFASKLSTIVRIEEFLDDRTRALAAEDAEWFALLSSIGCAAMSLFLFGIWPELVTSMYMAYIAMQCFVTGPHRLCLPTGSVTSKLYVFITSEEFVNPSNQFSVWLAAAFTALIQAYYSYSGVFLFFSWTMFLLPAVKLFNLLSSSFSFDVSSLKFE